MMEAGNRTVQETRHTDSAVPVELGTEPIGKLLKAYALPAIIAMTASSLYNMIDSIFIGHGVGPLALAGLALTFPLMNLSSAFGTLVGVGGSTILSVLLGQKNYAASNKVVSNIVTLNLIIGLLFTVAVLLFLDPVLYFFGASENTIVYAREYMQVILYGNIITHVYFGLNSALRASGAPKKAMFLTLLSVVLNVALAPVFIFWLGMGIRGAALATVIAQVISLCFSMKHFSNPANAVHFEKGIIRLNWRIAKDSLAIGFGPFLMNSAACLVSLFIVQQFSKYSGDLGIGAYGIDNRVTFIFIMICMGLNQGMQPIAGYNYGARKYSRVKEVYRRTVIYATAVTSLCFIVSVFFPDIVTRIFTDDEELTVMANHGLRIMNIVFPFVGFQIVSTNLFQCLGMVNKSIFLSLARQILCLLPVLYLLPLAIEADGIWWSFPISDAVATILTVILIIQLVHKLRRLKDGDDPAILGSKI